MHIYKCTAFKQSESIYIALVLKFPKAIYTYFNHSYFNIFIAVKLLLIHILNEDVLNTPHKESVINFPSGLKKVVI